MMGSPQSVNYMRVFQVLKCITAHNDPEFESRCSAGGGWSF